MTSQGFYPDQSWFVRRIVRGFGAFTMTSHGFYPDQSWFWVCPVRGGVGLRAHWAAPSRPALPPHPWALSATIPGWRESQKIIRHRCRPGRAIMARRPVCHLLKRLRRPRLAPACTHARTRSCKHARAHAGMQAYKHAGLGIALTRPRLLAWLDVCLAGWRVGCLGVGLDSR